MAAETERQRDMETERQRTHRQNEQRETVADRKTKGQRERDREDTPP